MFIIDLKKTSVSIGAVDRKGSVWVNRRTKDAVGTMTALVQKIGHKKPTHVVLVNYRHAEKTDLQPSWSQFRAGAVLANTTALAWGVPVHELMLTKPLRKPQLIARAVEKVHTTKPDPWIIPTYNADPNITTPKPTVL